MSAQPLESRIAHIEGASVQIADRLNGIDSRLDSLDRNLRSEIAGVRGEIGDLRSEISARFGQIDQKFMWVIGIIVTSWTTTMLALLFHH